MITFLIGIAILVGGYFTYGKFVVETSKSSSPS